MRNINIKMEQEIIEFNCGKIIILLLHYNVIM